MAVSIPKSSMRCARKKALRGMNRSQDHDDLSNTHRRQETLLESVLIEFRPRKVKYIPLAKPATPWRCSCLAVASVDGNCSGLEVSKLILSSTGKSRNSVFVNMFKSCSKLYGSSGWKVFSCSGWITFKFAIYCDTLGALRPAKLAISSVESDVVKPIAEKLKFS